MNQRNSSSPLPCCAKRGSEDILAAFQAELAKRRYPRGVKVSASSCLTSCQCGPTVVVYPEGVWYGSVAISDIPELFEAHLSGQGPVSRLLLPDTVRVW